MAKSFKPVFQPPWGLLLNLLVVGLALAAVLGIQLWELDSSRRRLTNFKSAETQEALKLKLIERMPSLGYDNLIADWGFLNLLQYYGDDEAREVTGYSLNAPYFDLITQRDPRFVEIYPYLSTGISFYLGNPQLAVSYMKRGTNVLSPKVHPQAFIVWRYKGLDELLLMGDTKSSIESHKMAAKWAASEPFLANLYQQTADFLKTNPDSKLVRFRCWVDVYSNAVDKRVKARAKQEILQLGGKINRDAQGRETFTFGNSSS